MEKKINRLMLSVLVTIILVLISVPLWDYASKRKGALLASSYGDLSITVNMDYFPELLIIEDDRAAEFLEETPVTFRNPNDTSKKFDIYYMISKRSTIDNNLIVLSIDDKILHLKDLEVVSDNDNYYYKLTTASLGAYSDKTYNIRIWLDESTTSLDENVILVSNFITR